MTCFGLRKILSNSSEICIKNVMSNIQSFKPRKLCDKNFQHLHRVLPRCLYHSFIQRRKYDNEKHVHFTMNKKLNYKHIMMAQNFGMLRISGENYQMHQSKRHFGDSAGVPDFMIGSNAPIGQYESFVTLLANSAPVEFCQNTLLSLHSSTGLPWWAIIILVTCGARTVVTVPFSLYQQYIFAKVVNLKCEMDEIVKELKIETNRAVDIYGWTETYARSVYNRSLRKQWQELIIRENCHPMKGIILALVQFPIWITISASFRNLCFMMPRPTPVAQETFVQLSTEGFGWVSDLTAVDTYYILPVLLGIINLTNIEVQALLKPKELTTAQKIGTNIFRGISIIMVPLACIVPSCMSLYWMTSSAYGLVQSFIVVSPRIRRFVRIPETEIELKQPYKHLYDNFKEKYAWIYLNK